jgi:hypothetical protein
MSADHISTEEIERDIADTEAEIVTMQREMDGLRLIGDRMSLFRADARRYGIQERREFIDKLQEILRGRANSGPSIMNYGQF